MTMCEWCGKEHPQSALCTSRPKWSRRGFLTMFGVGIAGAVIAAKIPFAEVARPGTIGGIDRATFSFWRNQQTYPASGDSLKAAMREFYNKCSINPDSVPDVMIISAENARALGVDLE